MVEGIEGGGPFSGPRTGSASEPAAVVEEAGGRLRFKVDLHPGETTIVSWKKLLRDAKANKLVRPDSSVQGPEAKGSSNDEDVMLFNVTDDDEYDSQDSFIDDAELDEYFQVDNSEIKHHEFFVNRGKLDRVEPTSTNHQPNKRKQKDSTNGYIGSDDVRDPNKIMKMRNKGKKASSLNPSNPTSQSHKLAMPGAHGEDMSFRATPESSMKMKRAGPKITEDSSGLLDGGAIRNVMDVDGQKPEVLSSKIHGSGKGKESEAQDISTHGSKGKSRDSLSNKKPKLSEIVEYSEKRKRGRPRKFSFETSQNVTDYLNKKDDNPRIIPMMEKHPLALMGPQGLPFVKNIILWKTLEATDPFQRIPQNPHFQPLQHITECLREGEAISYMVTFAGVVEKVHGLQFGDPKSVIDDILEAFVELENHGFNIKPIRDRVSELLVMKEKEEILVCDMKEINVRILEHRQQKDKVEEEIEGIKKAIQKMEQRLSVLESMKEKEEGEAAAAVHHLKKTEVRIEDVKREFERIVSSDFDR